MQPISATKMKIRNLPNRRGFTLVEMLVVVVVLSMIAAVVTPSLVSMKASSDRRSLISAIRTVAADARERAISSARMTQVSYDESSRQLRIEQVQDDGTTQTLKNVQLTTDLEPQRYQLEGKDATAGDFKLTFAPNGHSNGGGIEFTGFSILVNQNGNYRFIDGPLPQAQDEKWQAGDLEQRS